MKLDPTHTCPLNASIVSSRGNGLAAIVWLMTKRSKTFDDKMLHKLRKMLLLLFECFVIFVLLCANFLPAKNKALTRKGRKFIH
jgi:hypothetical protein